MENEKKEHIPTEDTEIIVETELDMEAYNVIKRLYDKTFRELVDR